MYKKTKIVATISDVRCDVGLIQRLYDAGMNVVRLNTAHQDATGMKRVIDNVREVSSHLAILGYKGSRSAHHRDRPTH